jgi:hypothetical protein
VEVTKIQKFPKKISKKAKKIPKSQHLPKRPKTSHRLGGTKIGPRWQWVEGSGGTNQTIIWLIDKFSLFEINRYLINLCQTIQIIQKGDFWGKNRRFLAI